MPTSLEDINLAANHLTSSLPTQLGTLTSLVNLHLEENNLHSSLPTQLGVMQNWPIPQRPPTLATPGARHCAISWLR